MGIMRYKGWEPFREMARLLNWRPALLTNWDTPELCFPTVDVEDKGDAIVIKAEMPGVKAEDMEIELHDSQLIIRGEKNEEREEKDEKSDYYCKERIFGSFCRTISLGHQVDPEKVKAEHKDGLLTITLEKSEAKKAKKIEVKST
jgi:HSP20 family protein